MRSVLIILLATTAIFGCDAEDRVIQVIDARAKPVVNATVSIIPGMDQTRSIAMTDATGTAKFGTGDWDHFATYVSIKQGRKGQCDSV